MQEAYSLFTKIADSVNKDIDYSVGKTRIEEVFDLLKTNTLYNFDLLMELESRIRDNKITHEEKKKGNVHLFEVGSFKSGLNEIKVYVVFRKSELLNVYVCDEYKTCVVKLHKRDPYEISEIVASIDLEPSCKFIHISDYQDILYAALMELYFVKTRIIYDKINKECFMSNLAKHMFCINLNTILDKHHITIKTNSEVYKPMKQYSLLCMKYQSEGHDTVTIDESDFQVLVSGVSVS